MNIRLNITNDSATPALRAARTRLMNKMQLNRAGAEGMLPIVQRNFVKMAATNHNAFGVRSSFWHQMLSGTYAGADENGGFVAMPRPVALRFFGGTVTPKVASMLAIPARTEAYNKSPRDFSDLHLARLGVGPGGRPILALVQNEQQKIGYRKQRGGGVKVTPRGDVQGEMVFYWLVPQATIRPDPDVLPDLQLLGEAAEQAVVDYIGLTQRRSQ